MCVCCWRVFRRVGSVDKCIGLKRGALMGVDWESRSELSAELVSRATAAVTRRDLPAIAHHCNYLKVLYCGCMLIWLVLRYWISGVVQVFKFSVIFCVTKSSHIWSLLVKCVEQGFLWLTTGFVFVLGWQRSTKDAPFFHCIQHGIKLVVVFQGPNSYIIL